MSTVPAVYSWVIGDVVEKMNRKFAELGLDENVLTDLKTIWETKIRQMGVATFPPLEGNQQQYQQQKHFHGVSNEEGLYLPHSNPANGGYQVPQTDGSAEGNDLDQNTSTKKLTRQEIDALILKNGLIPKKQIPQLDGDEDEDEEEEDDDGSELASDLDDDEDDENAPTDHLILCQYEKVSRIKNKWKCILKDGIVNINGRDYMFSRATGDFEW